MENELKMILECKKLLILQVAKENRKTETKNPVRSQKVRNLDNLHVKCCCHGGAEQPTYRIVN